MKIQIKHYAFLALLGVAGLTTFLIRDQVLAAGSPSTPTGLSATPTSPTDISVSWGASTGGTGAKAYIISVDGGSRGHFSTQVNTTSYSDTGLEPNTSYAYRVQAFDDAFSFSGTAGPVNATTLGGGGPGFSVTVSKVGTGAGKVTGGGIDCGAVCSINVPAGTNITLTATPNLGVTFEGWGGACSGKGTCVISVSSNTNVSANFKGAAGRGGDLTGWAWSSNIGWINFNCTQSGPSPTPMATPGYGCSNSDYKVTVQSDGSITGWAWSSQIGWIKFGGLSAFPDAQSDAKLDFDTGEVTGWIRACTGSVNGDCSDRGDRNDGWDGWIQLSDNDAPNNLHRRSPKSSGNEGVSMDPTTGKFNGFAWGGEVVGWVNFDADINGSHKPQVTCVNNCGNGGGGLAPLTIDCPAPITATVQNTGTRHYDIQPGVAAASGGAGGSYSFAWQWVPQGSGSDSGLTPFKPGSPNVSEVTLQNFPPNGGSGNGYYMLLATAKDSSGSTVSKTCGYITVLTDNSTDISLFIGPDVDHTTYTNWSTKRGLPFALKWTIQEGGKCEARKYVYNGSSYDPVSVANWDNSAFSGTLDADEGTIIGQVGNLTTKTADGVTKKKYKFALQSCRDGFGNTVGDKEVILELKDSSVIEI